MKKKKTGLWIAVILVILVIIVIGSILVNKNNGNGSNSPKEPELIQHTVKKSRIFDSLKETGVLEPVHSVEVTSKLSGKLLKFLVKEGDTIKKEQVIAYLEPDITEIQRITSIRSNFENAKTELDIAKKDFIQKEALYQKGIISESEYLAAKKRLTGAENSFLSSQQHMRSIEDLGIPENIENIERVDIKSPNSGILINLGVEEGESVRAGTNAYGEGTIVAVVANISKMQVSAQINEVDIGKIYLNQQVIITLDAFPGDSFKGEITFISPVAQPVGNLKKFDILIDVLSTDPRLKPGMTANLDIVLVNKEDIIVIPFSGLVMKDGKFYVRKKTNKGQDNQLPENNTKPEFELVEVKSGIKGKQGVEIESGLEVGEVIYISENRMGFPMNPGSNSSMNKRKGR